MIRYSKIHVDSAFFGSWFLFYVLASGAFTTMIESNGFKDIVEIIPIKILKLINLHIDFFSWYRRDGQHIIKSCLTFYKCKISSVLSISRTSYQITFLMAKFLSRIDMFGTFKYRNAFLFFWNVCFPAFFDFPSCHSRHINGFKSYFNSVYIVIDGLCRNCFHVLYSIWVM